ncbi:MAG: (d)CMP kinase [Trueperaceae bacterium]|nr:(d)CMP kinase [Trueperaceae bacterium]
MEKQQGDVRQVVTIDGPAASGKSSVAREVARRLEIPFVSSGLLYRLATYLVLRAEVDRDDEGAVLGCLRAHAVRLEPSTAHGNRVFLDDADVTDQLHTDTVDTNVSQVARHPEVRRWANQRLREMTGRFVVEGRDMGRVVFPEAAYKFYLFAAPEVRAERRAKERDADVGAIAARLRARDEADQKQLEPPPDAVYIDTSDLGIDEVVATVITHIQATRTAFSDRT